MEKVSHNHKDNSQVWITYKILLQLQLPSACNLANKMHQCSNVQVFNVLIFQFSNAPMVKYSMFQSSNA